MSQAASLQPLQPEAATQTVAAQAAVVAAPVVDPATIVQAPAVAQVAAPAADPAVAISAGPAEPFAAAPADVAIGTTAVAAPVPAEASASDVTTDAAATLATRVDAPPAAMGTRPTAVAHVGTPAPMPQAPSPAGSIGGALFALVLVVGLILVLGWLAKRMPGLGGTRGNPALRLVGSLALGPRDRVVVVEVGGTQLLLGVGSGGTRTLHTLTEPLPVAPPSKAAPAFAQLLAQHFGKKA